MTSKTITEQDIRRVYENRKNRIEHPEGQFDTAGRWYPSAREDAGVTSRIRTPSRAYPYSYMAACRTLKHVRMLAKTNPQYFQTLISE
jgi:hypothetical protein